LHLSVHLQPVHFTRRSSEVFQRKIDGKVGVYRENERKCLSNVFYCLELSELITGALKQEKADWVKTIKKSAGKIRHGLCLPDEETRAQAAGNNTGNEDWSLNS
jgi:hypothetical protein